ncbi:hypothetical protein VIGAN_03293900, partial [Vigna angularis var. angularis]
MGSYQQQLILSKPVFQIMTLDSSMFIILFLVLLIIHRHQGLQTPVKRVVGLLHLEFQGCVTFWIYVQILPLTFS